MYRRLLFCLCLALLPVFHASEGLAAPRDNSATQKIDEAINKYYLATDFDKAESILKGILEEQGYEVQRFLALYERIAYGFKSAEPLIALAMLHLGGYRIVLPGRA